MNHPGLIEVFSKGSAAFRKLNSGLLMEEEARGMAQVTKPRKSKGNALLSHAQPIHYTPMASRVSAGQPKPDLREPLLSHKAEEHPSPASIGVVITRCSTGHLDRDNLYAAVKPLVDALRYSGKIPGDTERDIDLFVFQKKVKRKDTGTLVEIIRLCS